MKQQERLQQYIDTFQQRFKGLLVARGSALLALAVIVITLVVVGLGVRHAFSAQYLMWSRLTALTILAAIGVLFLYLPLRHLRRKGVSGRIEKLVGEFGGRIETYSQLAREPSNQVKNSQPQAFRNLLASDALGIAEKAPVRERLPARHFWIANALTLCSIAVFAWLVLMAPANWRYGSTHLWLGWALADSLPPQRILVLPGNESIKLGTDVRISAQTIGFSPGAAQLHVQFGDGQWETAPMHARIERDPENGDRTLYEFDFYAVREPLRYYVSAAKVNSEEYSIDVVETPSVQNISLRYHYPEWTGTAVREENPGGNIFAVAGTRVEIVVSTDKPLRRGELVVNGENTAFTQAEESYHSELEVSEKGSYYIADYIGDNPVRLTQDFTIELQEDAEPRIKFTRPARDWRATSIEEVAVELEAEDDFTVENLELFYSINGGEWQSVNIEKSGQKINAEHLFALEEMGAASSPPGVTSGNETQETDPAQPRPMQLQPGDLISYYASAKDRQASANTDILFIEVQPFDRRFSQSQQSGGGAGGAGQENNEISGRQKEILVATWNLIRERGENERAGEDKDPDMEINTRDNAMMLSRLQSTLAEQAKVLADRAKARQLTAEDQDIKAFVENLELAVSFMQPAAKELEAVDLDEAVQPEQRALQHLLRAEAIFRDIVVAQQGQGGAGGGQSGRDLADIFELEMDLDKNQYETEAPVSLASANDQSDENLDKLKELARRQQELAEQARRNPQPTMAQRWRQEQLRRELEQLKRELADQQNRGQQQQNGGSQQASENQQNSEGQQDGSDPQQSSDQQTAGSQSGAAGSQSGQNGSGAQQRLAQQLQRATEAMQRAEQSANNSNDPEAAREAIEQANEALQQGVAQIEREQSRELGSQFEELSRNAERLYQEQQTMADELQQAMRSALNSENNESGLTPFQERVLEQRKRAQQGDLEQLERDLQNARRNAAGRFPDAAAELDKALEQLTQNQLAARARYAADSIRYSSAAEIAPLEGITTNALRSINRRTEQAQEMVASRLQREGTDEAPDNQLAQAESRLRQLRMDLNDQLNPQQQAGAASQNNPGQNSASNQQGGNNGDSSSGEQPGEQSGQQTAQQNGTQPGSGQATGAAGRAGGNGPFTTGDAASWNISEDTQLSRLEDALTGEALQEASSEIFQLMSTLRTAGVSPEDLARAQSIARSGADAGGLNQAKVEREYRNLISLIEKMEIQVAQSRSQNNSSGIHADLKATDPSAFGAEVEEYFRRLSEE